MALIESTLADVSSKMKPGDVILFGRIRRVAVPTHASIIYSTYGVPTVVEAMFFEGVYSIPLIDAMQRLGPNRRRPGNCWWLPLRDGVTEDQRDNLTSWLDAQTGKSYDWDAWLASLLPWIDADEDYDALMCIEVVGGALKQIGLAPKDFNPAMSTTMDICKLKGTFAADYYQLLGQRTELPWLN